MLLTKKQARVELDDLKCNDRTAWSQLEVLQKRKRYSIGPRAKRPVIAKNPRYNAPIGGRQSKLENPYAQVWSFLSRFKDIDTDQISKYLPAAIRVSGLARFHTVMSPLAMRSYDAFTAVLETGSGALRGPSWITATRHFRDHLCEFATFVTLAKRYYAEIYRLVGMGESYHTLVGCDRPDETAVARTESQMSTIFQAHVMPLNIALDAWVFFLGEVLFGHPYGPAIMEAWYMLFLEKSVARVARKRENRSNQRLAVQQGDVPFLSYMENPSLLVRDYTIQLHEREKVCMPAPMPYKVDKRLYTSWKPYIEQLAASDKRLLGYTARRTKLTYCLGDWSPVTAAASTIPYQSCFVTGGHRPTQAQITASYRGLSGFY
jgi:hypothetical protein